MNDPSAFTIRTYASADAVAMAEIYAHYVRTSTISFELIPPSATELAARFRTLIEQGYPVLVAEIQARVSGYAYASCFRARPAYQHTVEHSVYVDPACQKRGLGRGLMEELMRRCRARGYKQMVGVISDPEQHGSLAFHDRIGFREAGRLHAIGQKFGRELDVVLVQRSL